MNDCNSYVSRRQPTEIEFGNSFIILSLRIKVNSNFEIKTLYSNRQASPMKIQKPEKNVGYILLVIGLILIVLPVVLACAMLLSGMAVPQLVPALAAEEEFSEALTTFNNVCLIGLLLIVIIWGGSIITSRSVSLIKKMELKVTREGISEETKIAKKKKAKES